MGDWFETIADVEATPEEADRLGAEVLSWLVEQGIVMAEPTECILSNQGHRPGPNYPAATVEPWDDLHELATNGFRVVTGQSVFYSMGVDQVVCPRCGAFVVDDQDKDSWSDFSPVVDEWYMGGTGVRPCKHCGKPVDINEWGWSPPWGIWLSGVRVLELAGAGPWLRRRGVQPAGPSDRPPVREALAVGQLMPDESSDLRIRDQVGSLGLPGRIPHDLRIRLSASRSVGGRGPTS